MVITCCSEACFYTHLLFDLFLYLFQVGSQIHVHLVFGAKQSLKHRVCRHAHLLQSWLLELALQILNFNFQVINLFHTNRSQVIQYLMHS